MVKTKSVLIYVIVMSTILLLFSSFDAEFDFTYTTKLNISDKMMYYAFTSNMEDLNSTDITTQDENEKIADSYSLSDSSEYIKKYKYILYYLGYMEYPADNKFDKTLQSAVLAYQQNKKLEVTGILNTATMTALDAEALIYKEGQKGDAILNFQNILKDLKYFETEKELNGIFDIDTTDAVKNYQQNNNLAVTGTLNSETQAALSRNLTEQVPAK